LSKAIVKIQSLATIWIVNPQPYLHSRILNFEHPLASVIVNMIAGALLNKVGR
jgi:hypothetical protein